MVIGVIIVTHSNMAAGAKDAAEMIIGEQEYFYAIGYYVGESLEDLHSKMQRVIDGNTCEKWIIFADMFGATPSNVSSIIVTEKEAVVVTGFNLSMILETLSLRDSLEVDKLILQITDTNNLGVKYINRDMILNGN